MIQGLPLVHSYNLARLGNAGDEVVFSADCRQREEIARWLGLISLEKLEIRVVLKRFGPEGFSLLFHCDAEITQRCVVTLDPVPGRLERGFHRHLHFRGPALRQAAAPSQATLVLDIQADDGPEEIESLQYDLAGPVLEELVLSLDPYPRCPGAEFSPPGEGLDPSQSPFAVLKASK